MEKIKINLEGTNPVEAFDIDKERLVILQDAMKEAAMIYSEEKDAAKAFSLAFQHLGNACETPNEIGFCFYLFPEILSFVDNPMEVLLEMLKSGK